MSSPLRKAAITTLRVNKNEVRKPASTGYSERTMKIDLSSTNFKEILGKLSILKTNLPMLASIVIAVVAVLLFVPVKILSGSLEETVARDSIRKGSQIKSAKSQAVPKDQWKELDKYKDDYERDANQISLLAIRSTQRELLSYDIFPSPNDDAAGIGIFKAFGERYRASIDGLLSGINAGDCPSNEELIQGMARASGASSASPGYSSPPSTGRGGSRYDGLVAQDLLATSGVGATIRDEICLSRAKSISVYVNPLDLTGYEFWGRYTYDVKPEDAIQDCWYYQLGYWIIEDIVSTIGAMNSGAKQVFDSPVKRLMYVRFGQDSGPAASSDASPYAGGRSGMNMQVNIRPTYIDPEDMTGFSTDPHTNRVGDEDIDVVHFNFSVILEAKSVMPFMKELCSSKQHKFTGFNNELTDPQTFTHNQITILKSGFFAINSKDPFHILYRYGTGAVVELELACEYIFTKRAYDQIKPEEVKPDPEQPQNGAAQGAAGQR